MTTGHIIDLQILDRGSILLVAVTGELDMATAPLLHEELAEVDWERLDRAVFDLLGISFIDSSGLGALISLRNDHPDTEIALVAANEGLVAKVLELTAMRDLFPLYSSTEAALAET